MIPGTSITDIMRASTLGINHPGGDVPGWDIAPHVLDAHRAQVERMRAFKPGDVEVRVKVLNGGSVLEVLHENSILNTLGKIGGEITLTIHI